MLDLKSYKLGSRKILPILPSDILFGLILGITGALGGVSFLLVAATSVIIFAGSAQFIVIILIIKDQPILAIVIAGVLINVRHLMYGAAMHDFLEKTRNIKKIIIAYLLTDEAFLISDLTYRQSQEDFETGNYRIEDVLIGSGFTLWVFWNISTDIGYYFAEFVKNYVNFSSDFIVAATFLGYFIMTWSSDAENRPLLIIMSLIALMLGFFFQSSTLLILILVLGILIGPVVKNFSNSIKTTEEEVVTN